MFCVYLTSYSGNKLPPFYIGSTSVEKIRRGYHGTVTSKAYRRMWEDEISKSPEKFKTRIISTHKTRDGAYSKEQYLQIRTNCIRSPMYINMSVAGSNNFATHDGKHPRIGTKHSEKSKKIMSELAKKRINTGFFAPEVRAKNAERVRTNHHMKGKKHRPESIEKNRQSNKNRPGYEPPNKNSSCYVIDDYHTGTRAIIKSSEVNSFCAGQPFSANALVSNPFNNWAIRDRWKIQKFLPTEPPPPIIPQRNLESVKARRAASSKRGHETTAARHPDNGPPNKLVVCRIRDRKLLSLGNFIRYP